MNKQRRNAIKKIISELEKIKSTILDKCDEVSNIQSEEEDAFDCMPESLQDGDRGCAMQEAIDMLDDISGNIEDIALDLENEIDNLQSVIDL